ncbi:DUF7668 domain-containing protein [Effusibacillus consociatus]|uniref:DUF7668 domain-containing protein n=1 Tax=Effusibacillus consociatus TaxID=1117041 RepID=A0ABV9Q1C5_9BACL
MEINKGIKNNLKQLVIELINGNFSKLVSTGQAGRLTEEEIRTALYECNGELTPPPEEAYDTIEIYSVENGTNPAWAVDFDLWINNERSDLTLSCTVIQDDKGEFQISIDDLHVL